MDTRELRAVLKEKKIVASLKIAHFQASINNLRAFLENTESESIFELLDDPQKTEFQNIISEITNQLKGFNENKIDDVIKSIQENITSAYKIIASKNISFQEHFSSKIKVITSDLEAQRIESERGGKELEELIKKFEKAKKAYESSNKNLDDLLKLTRKRVNEEYQKILNKNDQSIEARRKQLTEDLSRFKENSAKELKEFQSEIETNFQVKVDNWNSKFDELEEQRITLSDVYEKVVKYYEELRIVEYSKTEKKSADIFRVISIILMIAVIVIITAIVFADEFDNLLQRFLLVFSLMLPAIYTSREASRHRKNSDKYAQMANELAAFEIVLKTSDLKPEVKSRITEEMFKRFFGNILNDQPEKNISDDLQTILSAVRKKD